MSLGEFYMIMKSMKVILSVLIICFSTIIHSQAVSAIGSVTIEIESHATYPYQEVKQEAINALEKAEKTVDWEDIVNAWIKVDGLEIHPDYNGDVEVDLFKKRVDILFDKFAIQKSQEVSSQIQGEDSKTVNYQVVDSNKTWTIKFSSAVQNDDLTKQGISVTDSKGNIVNIGIQSGDDKNILIITPPQDGYISGEKYTLNIGTKVHSNDGKTLKRQYFLFFNIR